MIPDTFVQLLLPVNQSSRHPVTLVIAKEASPLGLDRPLLVVEGYTDPTRKMGHSTVFL